MFGFWAHIFQLCNPETDDNVSNVTITYQFGV